MRQRLEREPTPWLERWRWYHYYFLLALFDLVLILSSMVLWRNSLNAYQTALRSLSEVGRKQTWVGDLRRAVVDLNAPGNDIFASRQLDRERERFEQSRRRFAGIHGAPPPGAPALPIFDDSVGAMSAEAERIFAIFGGIQGSTDDPIPQLDEASARMASMDRHQADALRSLAQAEELFLVEQHSLLDTYERELSGSWLLERYFVAMIVFVLAGMFWFGRTLQRTNDRLVAAREQAREEHQARLAAIGEVCAMVAHGIRNPLAGICAAAQNAQDDAPSGPLAECLRDILSEAHRLDARAGRLLDFSQPALPRMSSIPLAPLLQSIGESLRVGAPAAAVEIDCPPQARAIADPDLLGECIQELAVNAIRASGANGRVRISVAARQNGRVSIRVTDDGPGIPVEVQPRLFELFFTTKLNGTGMGLANVRKLISAQQGVVELSATGPTGSEFSIELAAA